MIMFAPNIKVDDDLKSDLYDMLYSTERILMALEQLAISLGKDDLRRAFVNMNYKINAGEYARTKAKKNGKMIGLIIEEIQQE